MAISINGSTINLDLDTILLWLLIGLVAGFFASRVALGHGLGLFGDVIVGIIGALLGGFLAAAFRVNAAVTRAASRDCIAGTLEVGTWPRPTSRVPRRRAATGRAAAAARSSRRQRYLD